MKRNLCIEPGCQNPRWARKRCQPHDREHYPEKYQIKQKAIPSVISKKRAPIKKISDSMKETLKEYAPKRIEFLKANPICKLRLNDCTIDATTIEHRKGKATRELYLDEKYWWPSCLSCNQKVETLGKLAYERGLKIKHNSNDIND